jgi:hypothetical protein
VETHAKKRGQQDTEVSGDEIRLTFSNSLISIIYK